MVPLQVPPPKPGKDSISPFLHHHPAWRRKTLPCRLPPISPCRSFRDIHFKSLTCSQLLNRLPGFPPSGQIGATLLPISSAPNNPDKLGRLYHPAYGPTPIYRPCSVCSLPALLFHLTSLLISMPLAFLPFSISASHHCFNPPLQPAVSPPPIGSLPRPPCRLL